MLNLSIHHTQNLIYGAVTDHKFGMGMLGDDLLDPLGIIMAIKIDDAVPCGHGRWHRFGIQLEHVFDKLMLLFAQRTGLGARAHHGIDIIRGHFILMGLVKVKHAQQTTS